MIKQPGSRVLQHTDIASTTMTSGQISLAASLTSGGNRGGGGGGGGISSDTQLRCRFLMNCTDKNGDNKNGASHGQPLERNFRFPLAL